MYTFFKIVKLMLEAAAAGVVLYRLIQEENLKHQEAMKELDERRRLSYTKIV